MATMMLTDYGEEYFLKTAITEQKSVPANFQLGLSTKTVDELGESVVLGGINEVTGSGYSRQDIASDGVDWTTGPDSGDQMSSSKLVTFSATGTWSTAYSMFLTDGTGVIGVANLSTPRTLTAGKSLPCIIRLKQQ